MDKIVFNLINLIHDNKFWFVQLEQQCKKEIHVKKITFRQKLHMPTWNA